MNKADDLRVVRTRKLIDEAFFALVEEQGIESVNVRSLTAKAGINRGTFYLHYLDIYDLMEKMEDRIIEQLNNLPARSEPEQLLGSGVQDELFPSIVQFIRFMTEQQRFFAIFFAQEGNAFGKRLRALILRRMYEKLPMRDLEQDSLTVPADYIVAYFSSAHFGVIRHWFDTGRALPPEELALILTRLVRDGPLLTALNRKPERP
ncbi:TetR/AcrR family transcriptional regulator [Paenibacillus sp. HW567]|uniref:TetR/AcrR family transcriptional regulator n=1 Tax=Paenibacillus sp. HW567 TaxID=1034769 RepID=UPI00035D2A12|nr:TetR/AcrR family transcriptional regulator [Paenibacillus sp. HW567]